jgi:transglutaminase/protease-like cytokinesis protein 3
MHLYINLFLTLFCIAINAQEYKSVDDKVVNYPEFTSITELTQRISSDFEKDHERIRAVFIWMVSHMGYKDRNTNFSSPNLIYHQSEYGRKWAQRAYERKRINTAFTEKSGVCLDFSLLFEAMCLQLNIEAKTIVGLAKSNIIEDFKGKAYKDHTWNAVKVGNSWHLLDVMWSLPEYYGAEHLEKGIPDFSYYLPNPSTFIKTHLPEDTAWQLMKSPTTLGQFYAAPLAHSNRAYEILGLKDDQSGTLKIEDKKVRIPFIRPSKNNIIYFRTNSMAQGRTVSIYELKKGVIRLYGREYVSGRTETITFYTNKSNLISFRLRD